MTEAVETAGLSRIVLQGKLVRLEPLELSHANGLWIAGASPRVWRYIGYPPIVSLETAESYIRTAHETARWGKEHPFAIIDLATGEVAGSTRYLDLRAEHFGVEIGGTWLAEHHQHTLMNTECKLLLLTHAFEVLGMRRVQLKTDILNLVSQRAIERLGAVREGVLRSHMVRHRVPVGDEQKPAQGRSMRDTVMYSILVNEWPAVRDGLQAKLEKK